MRLLVLVCVAILEVGCSTSKVINPVEYQASWKKAKRTLAGARVDQDGTGQRVEVNGVKAEMLVAAIMMAADTEMNACRHNSNCPMDYKVIEHKNKVTESRTIMDHEVQFALDEVNCSEAYYDGFANLAALPNAKYARWCEIDFKNNNRASVPESWMLSEALKNIVGSDFPQVIVRVQDAKFPLIGPTQFPYMRTT